MPVFRAEMLILIDRQCSRLQMKYSESKVHGTGIFNHSDSEIMDRLSLQTDYQELLTTQRDFFRAGKTLSVQSRIDGLKKLKKLIKSHEEELNEAIYKDLKKSVYETFSTELRQVHGELNIQIRNVKKWSRKRRVDTNLLNFPGSSYIQPHPLGVSLVIGAWNYPYYLCLAPLIDAISAGNTVVLKPSELTPHSSAAMARLINDHFEPGLMRVVEGDAKVSQALLAEKWDKIFFTGSPRVGKIVMEAAAKNLTDVTLELGGKSPAIVSDKTSAGLAARRIVWGKYTNCGQTCIAPDYVLVQEKMKDELLSKMKLEIGKMYGDSRSSDSYGRIVNEKHFDRLTGYLEDGEIAVGGRHDRAEKWMEPTILTRIDPDSKVMEEEIFGPILPVIPYRDIDEAISLVEKKPHPLALYLFTDRGEEQEKVKGRLNFGGMTINDTLLHITNPNLPFGGVGNSGLGAYHGKFGFDAFSHHKSILKKAKWPDPFIKYPPYTDLKERLIRMIVK